MKRSSMVVGTLAAGLFAASVVHAANIPDKYVAHYEYSGGESELAELRDELDRVANQFAGIIRPIARKKLHERIGPYSRVVIDQGQGAPILGLGSQRPVPCDGDWHPVSNDRGEEGKLTCEFRGNDATVKTAYDKGSRTETIRFSGEGEVVKITSVVTSPKLPDEIRFQLSYQQS